MPASRSIAGLFAIGLAAAAAVSAQPYPSKPIKFVSAGVGTGADFAARLVAQGLSANLGRQVIVDNHPNGVILGQIVSKAPPDGYTIMFYGSSMWTVALLQNDVAYDPVNDFSPIMIVTSSPNVIVAHPSLPVKSVKDLIALAKARPGALNYASNGVGSSNNLAAEIFKFMAGVDIVHVPFKDGTSLTVAIVSGEVHVSFTNTGFAMPLVKAGKLHALAVTSAQPTALVPGLPTASASGLPGYTSGAMFVMFAPAKTPASVVNLLNQESARVLKQADVREKLFNAGTEPVGSSPEELAATMKSELARLSKIFGKGGTIRTQ